LVRYHDEPPFLFDLAADPTESKNLASSMGDRVVELDRLYRAWEAGTVAPLWSTRGLYASLADILARKPMRVLDAPEPGSIEIDF
jgi:hypothetical protein